MTDERDAINEKMYQAVCDLIHQNGSHLGKEDWKGIFDEALSNSFGDGTETTE